MDPECPNCHSSAVYRLASNSTFAACRDCKTFFTWVDGWDEIRLLGEVLRDARDG